MLDGLKQYAAERCFGEDAKVIFVGHRTIQVRAGEQEDELESCDRFTDNTGYVLSHTSGHVRTFVRGGF